MTEMNRDTLENPSGIGEVQIANEVVSTIAGISAAEVEGVDSMAGGLTNELAGRFGVKNLSKGVKVEVQDDSAIVDLAINMKYGYNIPRTCAQVQDKVSQAINSMTGLTVTQVNVRIAGVALEKE
ncbi:MAG: Asp23/Gls24 family envelope stress response protein [Lachnospiraceae bacterium]|nr:Asp23/Gls24 family envelope stress response protein [Lachnospiraceae bacterium]